MLSFLFRLIPAQEVHAHSGGHSKAANAARAAAKSGGGGGISLKDYEKQQKKNRLNAGDPMTAKSLSDPKLSYPYGQQPDLLVRKFGGRSAHLKMSAAQQKAELRKLQLAKEKGKAVGKKVAANRNESFTSGATNRAGSKPVTVVKSSLSKTSSSEYGKKLTAKQRKEIERDITMEALGVKPGKRTLAQETYKRLLLKEGYM